MFNQYQLSDLVEKWIDNRGKTPPLSETGIPLLEVKHLPEAGVYPSFEGTKHVTQETYDSWFRAYLEPMDILFSTVGTTARVTITPDIPVVAIAQNVLGIRFKRELADPLYMFYYMRAKQFQHDIEARLVTTVQASIKRADMVGIPIRLPEISVQKAVAKRVFAFDKKIELNRQTNQTLEQIAQAIFKSWFVDFEPTRAKIAAKQIRQARHDSERSAALREALFADGRWPEAVAAAIAEGDPERAAMAAISGAVQGCTNAVQGRMPKAANSVDELDVQGRTNAAGAGSAGSAGSAGAAYQLSQEHDVHGSTNVAGAGSAGATLEQLLTTTALFPDALIDSELGEIPEGWKVKTFGDVSECFDSKRIPLSKKKREEKKPGDIPYYGATSVMDYVNEWIFDDIYLLLGEDGSVIKEDGTPFVQYIWDKAWVNNHAHVLQGRNGVSTEQLMIFIQNENITAYITGAVQLKLNQGNMNSIPFLDAGSEINGVFYDLIAPLYEKTRQAVEENKILEEFRDVLLPKLLSGELELASKGAA